MANSKHRAKKYQTTIIREIILCVITLFSLTFALFFLFKYHAMVIENDEMQRKIDVYEDPVNPYISPEASEALVEQAKEDALREADSEAVYETLEHFKIDLIESQNTISAIRALYPDYSVVMGDDGYMFIPANENLTLCPYINDFFKESDGRVWYDDDSFSTKTGIDVSKFQEEIDWSKVKGDGIEYAFIRVGNRGYSDGDISIDSYFDDNAKNAIKNDIDIGVYFFSQATNDEEAVEEAKFVLDAIEPYDITYPVVIDIETVGGENGRGNELSMQERTQYCITFCETIKRAGYTPMIYGNIYTFNLMLDMEKLEDYDKWFASYTDAPYFPYDFKIWQYSKSGQVAGIDGDVDLNISLE